jgi:hypothetical protein
LILAKDYNTAQTAISSFNAAREFLSSPHAAHPGEAVEEKKEETVSSVFVSDLEAAVKVFVEKWQDHPEGANALAQKHEAELVRQELRPLVFEEVRLQVDEEMRVLLQNLKVCCSAVWTWCTCLLIPSVMRYMSSAWVKHVQS